VARMLTTRPGVHECSSPEVFFAEVEDFPPWASGCLCPLLPNPQKTPFSQTAGRNSLVERDQELGKLSLFGEHGNPENMGVKRPPSLDMGFCVVERFGYTNQTTPSSFWVPSKKSARINSILPHYCAYDSSPNFATPKRSTFTPSSSI